MNRGTVLSAILAFFLSISPVQAQSLDNSPLASCPEYIAGHPIVSEIGWTVGCLLQAIHDRNKEVIAAFSELARCTDSSPCDGVLDESTSEFIFGAHKPGGEAGKARSIFAMLLKAQSVIITYQRESDYVTAMFYPRPGKRNDTLRNGWMKTFFACDFRFDNARAIWVVGGGFCYHETDVFTGSDEESDEALKASIDLNGNNTALPFMIWKPKK